MFDTDLAGPAADSAPADSAATDSCTAALSWMRHDGGTVLALGRRRRRPSSAIRRANRGGVTVYEPEDCDELIRQYIEQAPRRAGPTLIPLQV